MLKPHLTCFLHFCPADRNLSHSTCAQAVSDVFGHHGPEQVYLLLVKCNRSNKAARSCPLIPPSYRPTSVSIVPSPAFCPGNPYLALPGERAAFLLPDHCHLLPPRDIKELEREIQKSSRKRGSNPCGPLHRGRSQEPPGCLSSVTAVTV